MRTGFLMLLATAAFVTTANAQSQRDYAGHGYVFVAPGAVAPGNTASIQFGVGGEGFIYKGLAAGVEIGYLTPTSSMGSGIGMVSGNGSYYFLNPQSDRKVQPFVSSGYTGAFRTGYANLYNVGGGVNIWFARKTGLRLEFRDHIQPSAWGDTVHYWGIRTGILLR